jgi:hypothetical protein
LNIRRYSDEIEFIHYSDPPDSEGWEKYRNSLATGRGLHYSDQTGGTAELFFHGNSVSCIGERAPIGGIGNIYLDRIFQTDMDLYEPEIEWRKVLFSITPWHPGPTQLGLT